MAPPNANCTYAKYEHYKNQWRNFNSTAFNGSFSKFELYACHAASFDNLQSILYPIERQLIIIFSTLGLLGALLTILTLNQKRFRGLDFQLYRTVGYLEMIKMADLILMELLTLMGCDTSYECLFLWAHVGFIVMNIAADSIDLLVLFLCVERTVACLLPHYFQRLHTRQCYIGATVCSIVVPALFDLFQAFELTVEFNADENRYKGEPSQFSETEIYEYMTLINTWRFYIMAVLIMTTTAFSIWGFCAVARRRRNLSKDYGPAARGSTAAAGLQSEQQRPALRKSTDAASGVGRSGSQHHVGPKRVKKRETELCCLQLCLAAPIIINQILYATALNMSQAFDIGPSAFKKDLDFQTAMSVVDRKIVFYWLRMATNLTNVLAHALHFYLYLLFSVQVRHGFLMFLRMCRAKFKPQMYANTTSNDNNHLTMMSGANEMSVA